MKTTTYDIRNQLMTGGIELDDELKKNWSILTFRERQVFELLIRDQTTREIALQLQINEKTVRNHISNVIQKLNVKGRSQAIIELIRLDEIDI